MRRDLAFPRELPCPFERRQRARLVATAVAQPTPTVEESRVVGALLERSADQVLRAAQRLLAVGEGVAERVQHIGILRPFLEEGFESLDRLAVPTRAVELHGALIAQLGMFGMTLEREIEPLQGLGAHTTLRQRSGARELGVDEVSATAAQPVIEEAHRLRRLATRHQQPRCTAAWREPGAGANQFLVAG